MSVLKTHREISKAEYVNTANQIYRKSLWFLSRLSARFSRLLAVDTARLANEIVSNAEKANTMLPTNLTRYTLRKEYLLQAKASLGALDIQLTHIYELLMLNPEGAFTNKNSSEAIQKLNKMADDLGNLLDLEQRLLASVLKSDKRTFEKIIMYKHA